MTTLAVSPAFANAVRRHFREQFERPSPASEPTRCLTSEQASVVRGLILEALPAMVSGERLAASVAMSVPEFYLAFRGTFGVAPVQMSRVARLDAAKALLVNTALPVAAIAAQAGYAQVGTFQRYFRKETGMAPLEWRQSHGSR